MAMLEGKHNAPNAALTKALERLDLSGRTVIITGGGHGMGIEMTRTFAQRNAANIVIVGRTESKLKATVDTLSKEYKNSNFSYKVADVSSARDVAAVFASLPATPDYLINNAGYMAQPTNFVDADLDDYWKAFEINILGAIRMSQAFIRYRRARSAKGHGVVVSISTFVAYAMMRGTTGLSSYVASKAGALRWSESMSDDVPETEVRFVQLHPGAVKTDMGFKSGMPDDFLSTEAALPGQFAVWLVSDEAAFLGSRMAWANWDVDELLAKKNEIVEKDLLRTTLSM